MENNLQSKGYLFIIYVVCIQLFLLKHNIRLILLKYQNYILHKKHNNKKQKTKHHLQEESTAHVRAHSTQKSGNNHTNNNKYYIKN